MKSLLRALYALILLFAHKNIYAQQLKNNKPVLQVGNQAPEIFAFRWLKGNEIKKFEKGKVYLIEFGATWCVPCAAAIPHLSALSEKYKGTLSVISLFVQEVNNSPTNASDPVYVKKVADYVKKKGSQINYTVGVDFPDGRMDRIWLKGSGMQGIPYMFIIDKSGRIVWVGANPLLLEKIIEIVLKNNETEILQLIKQSEEKIINQAEVDPISKTISKDVNQNGDLIYYSMLSRYNDGQIGGSRFPYVTSFGWASDSSELFKFKGKLEVVGENLRRLYYMAYSDTLWNVPFRRNSVTFEFPDTIRNPHKRVLYGRYWYRPILEIKDSSLFESDYKLSANRYNYYLKLPGRSIIATQLQEVLQRDLKNCFGYEVSIETRLMPCWNLKVSSDEFKYRLRTKTPGGGFRTEKDSSGNIVRLNRKVLDIISQLELLYGYSSVGNLKYHPYRQPPFFDETGIEGEIDIIIDSMMYESITDKKNLYDSQELVESFETYRKILEKNGIVMERSEKAMKVIVIRDSQK